MLGVIEGLLEATQTEGGSNQRNPNKLKIFEEAKEDSFKDDPIALAYMFNPVDLKISRSAKWSENTADTGDGSKEASNASYGGGADSLNFTLVFDASEAPEVDLMPQAEVLYDLAYPHAKVQDSSKSQRARIVRIVWNQFKFTGYVCSVDTTVTLFDHVGRFKRMQVALKLEGMAFSEDVDSPEKYLVKDRDKKPGKPISSGGGGGGGGDDRDVVDKLMSKLSLK